jgi:hypothetical protein
MLRIVPSSGRVNSMITITGPGDHDRPEWLITMTGMRMAARGSVQSGFNEVAPGPQANGRPNPATSQKPPDSRPSRWTVAGFDVNPARLSDDAPGFHRQGAIELY